MAIVALMVARAVVIHVTDLVKVDVMLIVSKVTVTTHVQEDAKELVAEHVVTLLTNLQEFKMGVSK